MHVGMKKIIKYCMLLTTGLFMFLSSFAVDDPRAKINKEVNVNAESPYFAKSNINDGPYFFLKDDHVTIKWIYKDSPIERNIYGKNFNLVKRKLGCIR